MKNLFITIITFILSVSSFSNDVMDRNLMEDYGTDRFTVYLKIQDFYGLDYRIKDHRVDNNEVSFHSEGHMGKVVIKNDTKNSVENIPHTQWSTFDLFTTKDHNNSYRHVYNCYRMGNRLVKNVDIDRKRDIAVKASNLHRWIAYEEPQELLDNRMQIYQVRDLIRQINDGIKQTLGQRHLALSKIYLENLKRRAIAKIEELYKERSILLDNNNEWKPRTRISVNMDYFPARCGLPKFKG